MEFGSRHGSSLMTEPKIIPEYLWAFMATVADLIVRRLRDAGVGCLFGVPGGGSNLDLIEAAGRAGLPFVLTATETAGAIAALAQAEVTGRPGACLTTLGPGAASVVNGVACAFLDRAPLLVFTDSLPAGARDVRAPAPRPARAARADHEAVAQRSIPNRRRRDAWSSRSRPPPTERPGPVHLDCPGDVASAAARAERPLRIVRRRPKAGASARRRPSATWPRSTRCWPGRAAEAAPARRPRRAARRRRGRRSARSASAAACRRWSPTRRRAWCPTAHPWFAGVFTNASIERPLVDESDLLIGVGLDPVELIPRPWTSRRRSSTAGRGTSRTATCRSPRGSSPTCRRRWRICPSRLAHSSWDAAARARRTSQRQRAGDRRCRPTV